MHDTIGVEVVLLNRNPRKRTRPRYEAIVNGSHSCLLAGVVTLDVRMSGQVYPRRGQDEARKLWNGSYKRESETENVGSCVETRSTHLISRMDRTVSR